MKKEKVTILKTERDYMMFLAGCIVGFGCAVILFEIVWIMIHFIK